MYRRRHYHVLQKDVDLKGTGNLFIGIKKSFNGTDKVITDQVRTVFEAYQEILNKSYILQRKNNLKGLQVIW